MCQIEISLYLIHSFMADPVVGCQTFMQTSRPEEDLNWLLTRSFVWSTSSRSADAAVWSEGAVKVSESAAPPAALSLFTLVIFRKSPRKLSTSS